MALLEFLFLEGRGKSDKMDPEWLKYEWKMALGLFIYLFIYDFVTAFIKGI